MTFRSDDNEFARYLAEYLKTWELEFLRYSGNPDYGDTINLQLLELTIKDFLESFP